MGFNPHHCELCGKPTLRFALVGQIHACEKCIYPAEASRMDEIHNMKPRRTRARAVPRVRGLTSRQRNQQFRADYLGTHSCVDCEEDDPDVLEFDHIPDRGKKVGNISEMVIRGAPLDRMRAEIAKCDVVCANCHRKRTKRRSIAHQRAQIQR